MSSRSARSFALRLSAAAPAMLKPRRRRGAARSPEALAPRGSPRVVGQLGKPGDLPLALAAGGVVGGRRSISAAIRLRIWSAKWGVDGAGEGADVLALVAVAGVAPVCSLGLAHRGEPIRRPRAVPPSFGPLPLHPALGLVLGRSRHRSELAARGAGADRGELGQLVDLGLEGDRERVAVADQPDVVVEGARRVVDESGLRVAEEASQAPAGRPLRRR